MSVAVLVIAFFFLLPTFQNFSKFQNLSKSNSLKFKNKSKWANEVQKGLIKWKMGQWSYKNLIEFHLV